MISTIGDILLSVDYLWIKAKRIRERLSREGLNLSTFDLNIKFG